VCDYGLRHTYKVPKGRLQMEDSFCILSAQEGEGLDRLNAQTDYRGSGYGRA
jgi:hypothetical protein